MAKNKPRIGGKQKLRRRWLTWLRMMRYGANNFTRNAWLTTAATAVMTITLLIVFMTLSARTVLNDTVTKFRQDIDIPIFLRGDIDDNTVKKLSAKLRSDSNVTNVQFVSSDQAKQIYIDRDAKAGDVEQLRTIAEAGVVFPAQLNINVQDPSNLDSINQLVTNDNMFKLNLNQDVDTVITGNQKTIQTLSAWASTTEKAGLLATVIFTAISMLIVFNTIRMAIFNRRDEIEMMKLIGADKGFIRGPFVVEAVMYGFFAALIATGLGYLALMLSEPKIKAYGIETGFISDTLISYLPLVLIAMIAVGALIGVISSRLAVRRYLKV